MQSLLGLGQDVNGVTTANQDHVIKNEQPIECDYWLSPSLVAMAAYVLNTCPIHSRYIRRGRGEHKVKAVDEFFITSKQVMISALFKGPICYISCTRFVDFSSWQNAAGLSRRLFLLH